MTDNLQQQVWSHLDQLEQILKSLELWQDTPPSEKALQSQQPFCVDTLSFDQWLQWVFIERMKLLIANRQPLPQKSAVLPMAEVVYANKSGMDDLLKVLKSVDDLFGD